MSCQGAVIVPPASHLKSQTVHKLFHTHLCAQVSENALISKLLTITHQDVGH